MTLVMMCAAECHCAVAEMAEYVDERVAFRIRGNYGPRPTHRPDVSDAPAGPRRVGGALGLAGLVLGLATPPAAEAACNLIPQTTKTFDSVVGTTTRPFAAPGELIEVAVRPCDSTSAGLTTTASDHVVTVLFTPSGSAARNAMVLTAGTCSALSSELTTCQSQLGGGQVQCVEGSAAGMRVVQRADGAHLQFLFPDTDALVGSSGDGLTLAGPATIAVTRATAPSLPCGLATATCTARAGSIPGLVACVDDFFTNDGACGTGLPQGIFNHFTALPYPNDFAGACIGETPPCNPTATQFRLTTDEAGNALLPMNWSGILVRPGGLPVPRLLSASLSTPLPITFPGQSFFASFSPDGGPLAPIFVPQFDATSSSTVLSLFGSADAPYTVLRIARRSDSFEECHGGTNDGLPCNGPDDCPAQCSAGSNAGQRCTSDAQCPGGACSTPSPGTCGPTVCTSGSNAGQACTADRFCPGGECGPAVFTLTPLVYAGNGPVVLPRQPGVCASGSNSGGAGTTERVSVDSAGAQANGAPGDPPAISADGRYVAFDSGATNLVPGDTNARMDVFVHDRLTGATERVSVDSTGAQAQGLSAYGSYGSAISADGHSVAFTSWADNLVLGDTNSLSDAFVHAPDPNDLASDLTGDGDQNDTVLAVLDTTQASPSPVSLCPADAVSVAGGAAAFLRPESAGATPKLPNCPAGTAVSGGVDLNGNANANDEVVHLALNSTTIQNFGVAATAVSLSGTCSGGANGNAPCVDNADCPGGTCIPSVVAALVSEAGQNADLNGDGDLNDTVVEVHPAASGAWTNVHQAADTVQVEGTLVAFVTPEAAQGNTDLNGDGDTADRVLQLFDPNTNTTTNTRMSAEEFVMGTQPASCGTGPIVAFRTSEAAQGNTDLNGDGDATDYVLQLYVPGVGVINTHEAVTPCALPACDPRQPYLVQGDTVKFLTYEGDQKQDLNGNGTQTDLILQIFDACKGVLTSTGAVDTSAGALGNPLASGGTTTQSGTVFMTTTGVCVSGNATLLVPAMCTTDDDCPQGATCQPGTRIVAAPAATPTPARAAPAATPTPTATPPMAAHEDSVVVPPKPLTVVIPAGKSGVTATLKVTVRNGDVLPNKETPGHTVLLALTDGTCPAGTVAGLPDFAAKMPGAQPSILLKGGTSKTAKVPLSITSMKFPTVNQLAPVRCTLNASVSAAGIGDNLDPTPDNNSVPIELNVIDRNNPQASSAADAVIESVHPVKLTIGKHTKTELKRSTVAVHLFNADSAQATLTVTASDGTCPAGTIQVGAPSTVTVAGGSTARLTLQVTATNAGFLTANGASPSRCIGTLSVAGSGGPDPDPTNNTTQLVIDVTDKEDF
jgi:hypothetical protein